MAKIGISWIMMNISLHKLWLLFEFLDSVTESRSNNDYDESGR